MQQMNPVNPALANLLQVASMVTPEQTPTVAAQVAGAAEQMMVPSVRAIAQDAGIGNQVQMQQQQNQQQQMMQALQQLMQQKQAQESAMRFGVAAAPGAQNIKGMADGGIVGYAAGNPDAHPLNDPEKLKEARELLRRQAYEEFKRRSMAAAAAPGAAAKSQGILSTLLRNLPTRIGGVAAGLLTPSTANVGEEAELARRRNMPATDDLGPVPGTGEGDILGGRPGSFKGTMDVPEPSKLPQEGILSGAPAPVRPPAPARPAPVAAPQLAGPSRVDEQLKRAEQLASEYETKAPSPEDVGILAGRSAEARDKYLQSRGVEPDQYKRDLEASQARQARKLEEIDKLAGSAKAAREGLPGLISLLAAAGGRTDPLTAIGRQYGNNVAAQLADDERFMNARERVRDTEDTIQASIREKRRAEAMGDFKSAEDAAAKERDARNKQREAQIVLATKTAELLSGKEEKALDRQTQVLTTQMQVNAQRESAAAAREGTLETRRATIVANVNRDEDRALASIENNYNKRLASLGVLPGVKPTADQAKALQEAQAEREAAQATVRAKAAETRAMVMGGTGGGGGIKVERIK